MVRVKLPKPQPKAGNGDQAHTTVNVSFQEGEGSSSLFLQASLPEQPQMNGGKGRKGNLNVTNLCLSRNAGLPIAGYFNKGPVW